MAEMLRPLPVFAATFAAWSIAVLVLALAGMGGRVGPHPANPALAPPIPAIPQPPPQRARLGPLSQYRAIGERPLLQPDRRPLPVMLVQVEQTPFEGVLTSVLLTATLRLAIFSEQGGELVRRVREGDAIPGTAWRLARLEPRQAILEGPEGQRVLDLRVFDGQGGKPPTVVSFPSPQPRRGGDGGGSSADPGSGRTMEAETTPVATGGQVPLIGPLQAATLVPADAALPGQDEAIRTAEEQARIEAIRARIEARRAQLREQGQNLPVPVTDR